MNQPLLLPGFERHGKSNELVVILHAFKKTPADMAPVRNVVMESYPDADLYIPALPTKLTSAACPLNIVNDLLGSLDEICMFQERTNSDTYKKIIFVGHSIGALLARKLYISACGEIAEAPIEKEILAITPRPWAKSVERIVLVAGMNRGWSISHYLSLSNAIVWSIGNIWGNIKSLWGKTPLIFTLRRGSPFITQLRIHWIHMRNAAKTRNCGEAITIQLLGSVDDMVSPKDNIDLISGRDFIYLDVPYSGHGNVIELNDTTPLDISDQTEEILNSVGEARASVFRVALTSSKQELIEKSILPGDLPPEEQRHAVTDVAFVVHGIRDKGYWTHKVARQILTLAKKREIENVVFATETSSYGYFPMLPFLLPSKRREKVEWLMDQYAEALALYPNAEFSFVGHSNGTYLIARAVSDYPLCKFKNVVLAGSVVHTGYGWKSAIQRGQVKRVLNYVATADWVVALFPGSIQKLKFQDLGSAGHNGFDSASKLAYVDEVRYIRGFHGAALNEKNWEAIAHFILTGERKDPPPSIAGEKQHWLVKLAGIISPLAWVVIVAVIGVLIFLIVSSGIAEWAKTLAIVLLVIGIWKVITKF